MKRASVCLILALIFVMPISGIAEVTLLYDEQDRTEFEISFDMPRISTDARGFSYFYLEDFGRRGEEYQPRLLGHTFNVAVPKRCEVSIVTKSVEWTEWHELIPAPYVLLDDGFIPFEAGNYTVGAGGWIKQVWDNIWRGVRVVGVDVCPIEYDPANGVRFMKRVRIAVNHPNGDEKVYDERLYHPAFEAMYRACLINARATVPAEIPKSIEWDPADGAELLVIVTPTLLADIQQWLTWKNLMGMPIHIVTTDSIGTTTSSIKAYIQNAYDNWTLPPVFVLLVGDGEYDYDEIPAFGDYSGNAGDNDYGTVDGDDIFPDIFPGRMSADNVTQLRVIVKKHLNYEKTPVMTDPWWARAVGIVEEAECTHPLGPDDSSYVTAVYYAMHQCSLAGYVSAPMFRQCLGYASYDVEPYINAGCGFTAYRGNWTSDMNNLLYDQPVGAKAPITVFITCSTAGFMYGDENAAEVATRAGTVSAPRGCAAFMGQSLTSTNTLERSSLLKHIFEGFFEADLNALAQAQTYGKIEMYSEFGGSGEAFYEYGQSVLLGSPEMLAWTAPIDTPIVTHPPAVDDHEDTINVTVSTHDGPVKKARVALHQGDEFCYGFTDSFGSASIGIDISPLSPIVIVVTGPNILPYIDTIYVIVGGVAVYPAPTVFSDITGNHDGLINPGEVISFVPVVMNLGSESASGLAGKLRCSDSLITLIDTITSFPTIDANDTVSGDSLSFCVSPEHPEDDNIGLTLFIVYDSESWIRTIIPAQPVHRFVATPDEIVFEDPLPYGNGNELAEPGEQVDVFIQIDNNTQADVFELSATMIEDEYIAVVQSYGEYGTITRGTSAMSAEPFTISISPAAPVGEHIPVQIALSGNCLTYTYTDTVIANIQISGDVSGSFTGPDDYGYYIIDDTDSSTGLALEYDWNDISAVGDKIEMITDSDDYITTIDLPFSCAFYGELFYQVGVSSNGHLTQPAEGWSSPMPYEFPSISEPAGVVAALWSDLAPHRDPGDIYSYYDSGNHQFVIQYDNIEFYYGGGFATCQIRICDEPYYPTPTNDCEMYFYYNAVLMSASTGVGIESPNQEWGLSYYFNGLYDITAAPLIGGRALRITTIPPTHFATSIWLYYSGSLAYVEIGGNINGIVEPGDTVEMRFYLKNGGIDDALATTAEAIASSVIIPIVDIGSFGDIPANEMRINETSPIVFYISAACPNDTVIKIPLAIEAGSGEYNDTIGLDLSVGGTGIEESDKYPEKTVITGIYPNPFNEMAKVIIDVRSDFANLPVNISVYDVSGRMAQNIYSGYLSIGEHAFTFDGSNLSSGIYFVKMSARDYSISNRLLLIK